MLHKEKNISVSGTTMVLLVFINALILKIAFIQNENWYAALVITLPLLLITIYYLSRKKENRFSTWTGKNESSKKTNYR